jgi:hypothetical protein
MSASTAEEEAAVLDRFLTRLALTEEDKLEKVLSKLLPVAIRNLASPHENTKTKVSCAPVRLVAEWLIVQWSGATLKSHPFKPFRDASSCFKQQRSHSAYQDRLCS